MRRKKYITKGEEFYKKNKKDKKKFKTPYAVIKATKADIDDYYNNDIEIDELINSYHKLNSLKFMKNNIALGLVVAFGTIYLGEIISIFFDKITLGSEVQESIVLALLTPLGNALGLWISVSFICYFLYKNILKNYRNTLDLYILPYEKKIVCDKIETIDKELYDMIILSE